MLKPRMQALRSSSHSFALAVLLLDIFSAMSLQSSIGIHFKNYGTHLHVHPTHILHMTTDERAEFTTLVMNNPKSGPLQLNLGFPTMFGPGKSALGISNILENTH